MKYYLISSLLTLSTTVFAAVRPVRLYATSEDISFNGRGLYSIHEGAGINYLFLGAPQLLQYNNESRVLYLELSTPPSNAKQYLAFQSEFLALTVAQEPLPVDIANDGTVTFPRSEPLYAAKNVSDPYRHSEEVYAVVNSIHDGAIPIGLRAEFEEPDDEHTNPVEPESSDSEKLDDKTSEGTGDKTSEATGDKTSDKTSDGTNDKISDDTSDKTSDGTSDKTSDGTSDKTSDGTSDKTSSGTSDKTSDDTSDKTSSGTNDKTSDNTSGKTSNTSQTTSKPSSADNSKPKSPNDRSSTENISKSTDGLNSTGGDSSNSTNATPHTPVPSHTLSSSATPETGAAGRYGFVASVFAIALGALGLVL